MIVYIENTIVPTKMLLDLISEFGKSSRIQSQHSEIKGIFVQNEISERETRKNIPFTIATRKIKYL